MQWGLITTVLRICRERDYIHPGRGRAKAPPSGSYSFQTPKGLWAHASLDNWHDSCYSWELMRAVFIPSLSDYITICFRTVFPKLKITSRLVKTSSSRFSPSIPQFKSSVYSLGICTFNSTPDDACNLAGWKILLQNLHGSNSPLLLVLQFHPALV